MRELGQISALARLTLSQLLAQADEKLLAPKSGFFGGAYPQGLSPAVLHHERGSVSESLTEMTVLGLRILTPYHIIALQGCLCAG